MVALCTACAAPSTPVTVEAASTSATSTTPSVVAKGRAAPPNQPTPRAHIDVSVLTPDGDGAWGTLAMFGPEARPRLEGCYVNALERDPEVAGWLYIELDPMRHTATLGPSAPLPATLQGCLVERAKELAVDPTQDAYRRLLYVSLWPEP